MSNTNTQEERLNAELARIVGEAFIAGISLKVQVPLRFGREEGEQFATRMFTSTVHIYFDDQQIDDFIEIECDAFDDKSAEVLWLSVSPHLWSDGITRLTARQPEVSESESRFLALTHFPVGNESQR